MNKCHYIIDKVAGKVLIPGCMGVAVHNDIDYCTCHSPKKSTKAKKYQAYLHNFYNATSTEDGNGEIETYEAWLERQLLSRIEEIERLNAVLQKNLTTPKK